MSWFGYFKVFLGGRGHFGGDGGEGGGWPVWHQLCYLRFLCRTWRHWTSILLSLLTANSLLKYTYLNQIIITVASHIWLLKKWREVITLLRILHCIKKQVHIYFYHNIIWNIYSIAMSGFYFQWNYSRLPFYLVKIPLYK